MIIQFTPPKVKASQTNYSKEKACLALVYNRFILEVKNYRPNWGHIPQFIMIVTETTTKHYFLVNVLHQNDCQKSPGKNYLGRCLKRFTITSDIKHFSENMLPPPKWKIIL